MITGIQTRTPELGSAAPPRDRVAERDAAGKFEALLLSQMLRAAREASSGEADNQGTASMFEMAEQQFAELLSAQGGIGLAKMVVDHLSASSSSVPVR